MNSPITFEVALCFKIDEVFVCKSTMKVKDKSVSQTISGSSAIWMTCSLKTVKMIKVEIIGVKQQ